ncbi:MAG: acetylxylan esterase [Spirochaetota bacterium]
MREQEAVIREPADFDGYWARVLEEVRGHSPRVVVERWENEDPRYEDEYIVDGLPAGTPGEEEQPGGTGDAGRGINPFDVRWGAHTLLAGMTVRKVTFDAPDGRQVGGLLQVPRWSGRDRFPGIVHFTGYGGELLVDQDFVSRGYAVFNFSHRGMYLGSEGFDRYRPVPLLVRDVEDRSRYAYRGIVADCLAAIRLVRTFDRVEPTRIGVMGTSQGGGLAVITAALDREVRAVSADLPWLTDFQYQLRNRVEGPYTELKEFFARFPEKRAAALETLGYFDALFFAGRLRAPALVSLGQSDTTCPPDSVRTLFGRIPSVKMLLEIPGMGHERSTLWRGQTQGWFAYYI